MMGGLSELEKELKDNILQALRDVLGDKYAEQFNVTIKIYIPLIATVRISYRGALLHLVRNYDQEYLFNRPEAWTKRDNERVMYDFVRFVESEMTELLHELIDITYILRKKMVTL